MEAGQPEKAQISKARKLTAAGLVLAAAACAVAAFWPEHEQLAVPSEHAHSHGHDGQEHDGHDHDPARNAPVTAGNGAQARVGDQSVGADTPFQYIAVFPRETTSTGLEQWRQRVLGRVHETACVRGSPCLARLLRLSGLGTGELHAIAFDLQAEITEGERKAILSAAVNGQYPPPVLFAGMSANAAVSRHASLPISLMTGQAPITDSSDTTSNRPATTPHVPLTNLQ